MDPQTKDMLEAAIYSAGAVATVGVIARNWYLKRKSDNETQAQRVNAYKSLLESEAYQKLLQNRKNLVDSLETNHNAYPAYFESMVEVAYGKLPKIKV